MQDSAKTISTASKSPSWNCPFSPEGIKRNSRKVKFTQLSFSKFKSKPSEPVTQPLINFTNRNTATRMEGNITCRVIWTWPFLRSEGYP